MVALQADKTSCLSPPLVTDRETIASLPLLYRALADELIRRGRIIIETEEEREGIAGTGKSRQGLGSDQSQPNRTTDGATHGIKRSV